MEYTTTNKRARVDEAEDQYDYPRYKRPHFCQDGRERSYQETYRSRCDRCDRNHIGACTAFCRKCAEIGHSWRHCRLFVPEHIWRRRYRGSRTTLENFNITVPVINPAPGCTPASLNAAILYELDKALSGLNRKAGISTHSRISINNVNITTNILAPEPKDPPLPPDTSLMERVQRIPKGPKPNIPHFRPTEKPSFAQPLFGGLAFSQPVFGQTAFAQTFM
ncbi:hypothetical protein CBS147332_6327 [Penicillium roqueforti]|nr:hypothetical protein CBS147332_6327 [Penicillium roqueforti]KAI3098718.1 hypothetical protein CBS147331_8792 [Penicillium roqueforti]